MARKGLRKLIDIGDGSERLNTALERYLFQHRIFYEKHHHAAEGFYRYLVASADLCCAQAVIPALQEMAQGGRDVA